MTNGIDDSTWFLVLVTAKYRDKVNDPNRRQNCYIEFEYAQRTKGFSKFIIILRDESMSDPHDWRGTFGSCGGELYINAVNKPADEVCDDIIKRLSETVMSHITISLRLYH